MAGLNTFNRILGLSLGAALTAAAVVCVLVLTSAVNTGTLAPSEWFREQFRHLDALTGSEETIAIAAAGVAIAIGAEIVLAEIITSIPAGVRDLAIRDTAGNRIMMSPDSLGLIADQAALEADGITMARSTVRRAEEGVVIQTDAVLQYDANVAQKSRDLSDRIRDAIENRVGVKVSGLQMNLRLSRPLEAMNGRRSGWGPFHGSQGPENIGSPR